VEDQGPSDEELIRSLREAIRRVEGRMSAKGSDFGDEGGRPKAGLKLLFSGTSFAPRELQAE